MNNNRPRKRRRPFHFGAAAAWIVALCFLSALAICAWRQVLPWALPTIYAVMSLITYAIYWRDKSKAQSGARRTPEATLHWLELLGGWPGALAAQWQIGHKNRKASYQVVFWFIVFLHIGILILATTRPEGLLQIFR